MTTSGIITIRATVSQFAIGKLTGANCMEFQPVACKVS